MNITYAKNGQIQIVKLAGRLAGSATAAVRQGLATQLDDGSCLIIDCSALDYMDSSGLGVFVSSLRKAVVKGGDIRLAALMPKVRMLLELTRVDKVFHTYANVEDALTSFIVFPPDKSGMV